MSLWKIAWRSIQQRGLASSLTGFSMALGVMLVVAVLIIYGVLNNSFLNNSSLGYNVVVGAKGGRLDLVLNTVYYLARPVENIPYTYYQQLTESPYVDKAIPICLGDTYENYRVIGTTPAFFNELDYGGNRYTFSQGKNYTDDDDFGAVIGATVARETGLRVGDTFQPSHSGGTEAHVHEEKFTIRGVLDSTGTPNDRALFINMEGFYLIPEHRDEKATTEEHAAADSHAEGEHEHAAGEAHEHEHPEGEKHSHAEGEEHAHEHPEGEDHADHEHAEGEQKESPEHSEEKKAAAGSAEAEEHEHEYAEGEDHADHKHAEGEDHDHEHEHADGEEHAHEHPEAGHEHEHAEADHAHAHGHEEHAHDEHAHGDHAHDEHDHHHGHSHEPIPLEEREVTGVLVLTAGFGGPPELTAPMLMRSINEGPTAQAVLPIREMSTLFTTFVDPLRIVLLVLTVMIVVVSGIGILVSIYNSMAERQHEIAVMRALGAGRQTVMLLVLLESILLSLAGGVAGWVIGHGLIALLSPWIAAQTGVSIGFFEFVPFELVIIPGLIALAAVVGYLPALAAYRTDVAKALSATP